ncbi:MAG: glutamine--fructose-6-phosphate transaminase (isomerizing) [Bacillota bacterium]|nr:glutamine--fructose-6-phosphate transaminase (isomerizing) [Bacillota bacterium]
MCGIVGYTGPRQATPLLLEGLRRLEYRGYDSAGVAVLSGGNLVVRKTVGRLSRLEEKLAEKPAEGTTGIGHTRWATHGRPSDTNAHPHLDCTGNIAVVHNGIIENYQSLRSRLAKAGHVFRSETDTETLPHLIEEHYEGDLAEAVRRAVKEAEGSYAIAVVHRSEPDRVVAVRKDSPLVVGLGEGENYLASDIPALLPFTRRVYILDDGEQALVTPEEVRVTDLEGRPVEKEVFEVKWDSGMAEKGGYEDFMLKEIYEQPRAIRDTLAGRLDSDHVVLDEVKLTVEQVKNLRKVQIIACGTAFHAGLVGKQVIERLTRLPVEAEVASEFRYRDPMVDERTLAVVISQSGETADTLAGLRLAKRMGARVVAITNVVGSSVAREADDVIYTWAGPEVAVASTKAYLTQLVSLYLLALFLAERRGTAAPEQRAEIIGALKKLSAGVNAVLAHAEKIQDLAKEFRNREDIFFIGRGLDYAVSMEGSLKLKEISYIHAEAYAAGELKHGTLALIVEGVPVFALATQRKLYDKMLSNIKEVKARDATVVAIALEGDRDIYEAADHVLHIPETLDFVTPVLSVVPLQLFAYYAAKARGCDVDKPRNLAKSVTVE